MLRNGDILLAGKPLKASWLTVEGSVLDITCPKPVPTALTAQPMDLDIRYEDEWLLVINKPAGLVVHPGAGHADGTLANALLSYLGEKLSDRGGVLRPGIVHRIDKDTSGLLLIVKDNLIHAAMSESLRRHEIRRIYQAVVHGVIAPDTGTVDAPIGRDPLNRQRMSVVAGGKPSITHFRVLRRFASATLVEASLESGRTHQIRVHLAYIRHPVIGDPLYAAGRDALGMKGQALHAGMLSFVHPVSGDCVTVTAPLPAAIHTLLEKLA